MSSNSPRNDDQENCRTSGAELERLFVAARGGDEDAWSDLIRRTEPTIRSVARQFRLTPEDTADLIQSVWCVAYRNIGTVRDPFALTAWIRRVARNLCCDISTNARRTLPHDFSGAENSSPNPIHAYRLAADDRPVDDRLLRQERIEAIRRGLAELTPPQRKLLLLLAADPRPSYQAISKEVGMPIGSIGPTRARLLVKLADTKAVRCLSDTQADVATAWARNAA